MFVESGHKHIECNHHFEVVNVLFAFYFFDESVGLLDSLSITRVGLVDKLNFSEMPRTITADSLIWVNSSESKRWVPRKQSFVSI